MRLRFLETSPILIALAGEQLTHSPKEQSSALLYWIQWRTEPLCALKKRSPQLARKEAERRTGGWAWAPFRVKAWWVFPPDTRRHGFPGVATTIFLVWILAISHELGIVHADDRGFQDHPCKAMQSETISLSVLYFHRQQRLSTSWSDPMCTWGR